jgi:hypothetical protein
MSHHPCSKCKKSARAAKKSFRKVEGNKVMVDGKKIRKAKEEEVIVRE